MKNKIRWDYSKEVSSELIESVQNHFSVKFPKSYIEIIKRYDGGDPKIQNEKGNWVEAFLKIPSLNNRETSFRFYSYFRSEFYDMPRIISVNNTIKEVLPNYKKIIAFADNGLGDDLLFDYRNNEKEPSILFMKHDDVYEPEDFDEEELEEKSLEELLECNIHHVCNSFDELLDMLYPEDFD